MERLEQENERMSRLLNPGVNDDEDAQGDSELLNRISLVMAEVIDFKDRYTLGHSLRVAVYALAVARQYGIVHHGLLQDLALVAFLHDAGKVGVPGRVIGKKGPLTAREWQIMKKHPLMTEEVLQSSRFLKGLAASAAAHHERFDGMGYHKGLRGEEIPLFGRITAVADVFDALTSKRSYRGAWTVAEATEYLLKESGCQFDVEIVRAAVKILPRAKKVVEELLGTGDPEWIYPNGFDWNDILGRV
ncbi:HD-GYP domain-containing protein [Syntrophothermus sp.]|uniref:HD-GYP domain-containing protein n=1 Tax=Syntrophothermus sp. TaxID=2736299 RepID=UPI00257AC6FF|nr:HD-GYP domain-containing protein [Syntrophothermus sp.]